MSTKTKFHIHLSSDLWDEATVASLNRAGHTVTILLDEPSSEEHLYISHRAWRVPSDITRASIEGHMDMILKQAKVLIHENTGEDTTEGVIKTPKPKAKRKAKPKATEPNTAEPGRTSPDV